jgi:excisionase family DNA binding protein
VGEVAAMYDVHHQTVRAWIKTGKLAAIKLDHEYRITLAALDAMEQENPAIRSRCFAPDPDAAAGS